MTTPEAALADYLRHECRAQSVEILEFSRLTGGAIQDNHALTVRMSGGTHPGEHRLVVRSDAPSRIAASLNRSQEFHVLKVACEAGLTVPQPLWQCTDPAVLGRNFFIMRRAEGSSSPRTFLGQALDPAQAKALTRRLGEELALLHRVRPPHPDLEFLAQPADPPALHRVHTYQQALRQIGEPHPVLDWALVWLADHAPAAHDLALCHCDFRTGNYMVCEGRLSAVLDWEFATWSDPYEDLGWLCCRSWRFGVRELEVGGLGDKADLFAGYTGVSGRPVDAAAVEYWEIMGLMRWSVIALQQAQRHLSGEEPSLELALTGRMLPEMEFDLLEQIGHLTSAPKNRPTDGSVMINQPDGAALLDMARRTLMEQLLPALPPGDAYAARMVARAMGIAARELQQSQALQSNATPAIAEFLEQAGLGDLPADERTLGRLIRERSLPGTCQPALVELLTTLTRRKLALSNPRFPS